MRIQYKKRILAFVDVLGFSEIVLNSNHSVIENYFNYLQTSLKEISKGKNLELYYISDSIIISAVDNIDNFYNLAATVRYIQAQLLSKNILIRGAISFGDLYINKKENIIVGPSLVNAYKLESISKFPRIILDRRLIKHYNFQNTSIFIDTLNNRFASSKNRQHVSIDTDGQLYINYLSFICSQRQHYTTKKTINNLYIFLQDYFFQNLHLEKILWLKTKVLIEFDRQLEISEDIIETNYSGQKSKFLTEIPKWKIKFEEL